MASPQPRKLGRGSLLLILATGVLSASAFARPRGFDVPRKEARESVDVSLESVSLGLPSAGQPQPGVQVAIAGASLTGLWLAMLLAAGISQGKVARVRIYEDQKSDKEDLAVATIEGVVWAELPEAFRKELTRVGFVEQWPKRQHEKSGRTLEEEDFPRNVATGRLKRALLDWVVEAEGVELVKEAYSAVEHRRSVQDNVQCLVFADSGRSMKACEEVYEKLFAAPVADVDALFVQPERSLGVAFEAEGLNLGAATALSWAQRRYFLNFTGPSEGVLQMRLTPEEGRCAAELTPELWQQLRHESSEPESPLQRLWEDIREGCRLFGVPEQGLGALQVFAADPVDRPSYTRLPEADGPLAVFLLGAAARRGSAAFGPGLGAGGDLEAATSLAKALLSPRAVRLKQQVDIDAVLAHELIMKSLCARERQVRLGLGEIIASGLQRPSLEAEAVVLQRLEGTVDQLRRHPDRWPQEVARTLPDFEELRSELPPLSARAWAALAASGPWPDLAQAEAQQTMDEAEAAAYDFGGPTEEGRAAQQRLEQQCAQGSAEAMLQLGVMYVTANGVEKDRGQGFHWIQSAAELGHLEAMNCLGTMLRNGLGVEIRKEEAASWFQRAGDLGHAEAQFNLGEMLWDAEIPQDLERGVVLFEKAAQAELHAAQYKLGLALRRGFGVEMDVARGMQLIEKAAAQGLPEALYFLGSCYFSGDGVARDVGRAAQLFRRGAEEGDPVAQYSLGVMHEIGEGVPQNDATAQHWFRAAAAQGYLEAKARVRAPGLLPPAS
ncbi:unnamed protein product [Effrenium voratum]|nr:unnamed protein product [Effrenium voratum]